MGAAALYAATAYGPHWARDKFASLATEAIGRTVSIEAIDVSPLAARVVVSGLRIAGPPGDTAPLLSLASASLDLDAWASLRLRGVQATVHLVALSGRVTRLESGGFDFDDITARLSNGASSDASTRLRWRIERLTLGGSRLQWEDKRIGHSTRIESLQLSATGLDSDPSSGALPARLEASFDLDGHSVRLDGSASSLSAEAEADLHIRSDALPLSVFLPYLPLPAEIRPVGGTLALDTRLAWRPRNEPHTDRLAIEGRFGVRDLRIDDATGGQRLSLRSIEMGLLRSTPIGGTIHIADLALDSPSIALGRGSDGHLDWPPAGQPASPGTPAALPLIKLDRFMSNDGRLVFSDRSQPDLPELAIDQISLELKELSIPDPTRLNLTGQLALDARIDGVSTLRLDAAAKDDRIDGQVTLEGLALAPLARRAGPMLRARIDQGHADLSAKFGLGLADGQWQVSDGALKVSDLDIRLEGRRVGRLARLAIEGVAADATTRTARIGSIQVEGAALVARRDAAGRLDISDWVMPPAAQDASTAIPTQTAATQTAATQTAAVETPGWSFGIDRAGIGQLDLDYTDLQLSPDHKLPLLSLSGSAVNLSSDLRRAVDFEATIRLADGSQFESKGTLRPQPFELDARLDLQRFTLTHLDPYLTHFLNVTIAGGQVWSGGRLRIAPDDDGRADRITWRGSFSANGFRAIDKVTKDDFLRWTALASPDIQIDWRPRDIGSSRIEVGEVALIDAYARLILDANGRLNLADVMLDPKNSEAPRSITRVAPAAAPQPIDGDKRASQTSPVPRPAARVGTIRLAGGSIDFSDLFIRPNYNARLSQLAGSIDAIASDRNEPSDLQITGMVDDDTPLTITGQLNPLAPLKLIDLRAVARGFDLPRLTPYSSRWAGYAIEKGKLTADVRYRIEGERLEAQNRLTLNQLTFGPKVDSPDALGLPVTLAVALLKDRYGNIDLDLPISGSLSDPQFSVGALLWKALGNLIVRVVSSPFSFLASLGADKIQTSHVTFSAGEASLSAESQQRLDALALALGERPTLSLEIAGHADSALDREGLQQARFENVLKATKLAAIKERNPAVELPPLAQVKIDPDERPKLIEQAYRNARFDKPRNAVGLVSSLPGDEMEALLRRHQTEVGSNEVLEIAQRRARAARDYLRDTGGIDAARLFVLAPRMVESSDSLPSRRVDFSLQP